MSRGLAAHDSDSEETTSLLQGGSSDTDEPQEDDTCVEKVVRSDTFKMLVTLVIIMNAISMAFQVDHPDARTLFFGFNMRIWTIVGTVFTGFFVTEIALRLCADGKDFFCDPEEWGWNLFDFIVVFGGLGDHVLEEFITWKEKGTITTGRGIILSRMLRILRVLRVVRVFRSFRKLRMLARGLLESMKMVAWIFVLMLLSIFLCAIVCTTVIAQDISTLFPAEEVHDIYMYWGTVGRSMFTLFQFLTMDDWASVHEMVVKQQPYMRPFFFLFIFFGAFVLMSLLTGVMADHMNDVRRQEDEDDRREKIHQREHAIQAARSVDDNNDGKLNRDEFQKFIAKPEVYKDLSSTGIVLRPREARDLFEWFDVNGDGLIDSEELYHGLKHLFEGITGLQMYKLKCAIKRASAVTQERAADASRKMLPTRRPPPTQAAIDRLKTLTDTLGQVESKMGEFEKQVRSFMATMRWSPDDGSPQDSSHQ